jgi:hypothetical protein
MSTDSWTVTERTAPLEPPSSDLVYYKLFTGDMSERGKPVCVPTEGNWWKFSIGDGIAVCRIPSNVRVERRDDCILAENIYVVDWLYTDEWDRWKDEEFCLNAISQNPYVLKYIKRQTEQMCILAVKKNGAVLEFVNYQTIDIVRAAVKNNPDAVKYVCYGFKYLFAEL